MMCLLREQFIKRDCFQESCLCKPGGGPSPLAEAAEIARRINMRLLRDHSSVVREGGWGKESEDPGGHFYSMSLESPIEMQAKPEGCQGTGVPPKQIKSRVGMEVRRCLQPLTTATSCRAHPEKPN